MDRLLMRMARRYLFRYVGKGIDAGVEHMARRRNGGAPPRDMTREQRQQVGRTQKTARQALQVARRFGRF